MRSARPVLLAANLLMAALLVATFGTRLGATRAHHDIAYATLTLLALAAYPLLRRRRIVSLLLASLAVWSMLTGLFLVYVTPEVGQGRWMRWWHGGTSVGFVLAFLAHWARNQPRLVQLVSQLVQHRRLLIAAVGAWTLLAIAAIASWTTSLRFLFEDQHFPLLTTLALLLAAGGALYGGLVLTSRRVQPWLARVRNRNRVRGAIDASLLLCMWLATLTGLPLLYLGRPLRGLDAYWTVAGWHVITSALLLALVAGHVRFNLKPLRAHAR